MYQLEKLFVVVLGAVLASVITAGMSNRAVVLSVLLILN